MKKNQFLLFMLVASLTILIISCEQDAIITDIHQTTNPVLDERFKNYEIVEIDNVEIWNAVEEQTDGQVNLDMRRATPDPAIADWSFHLNRVEVEAEDFKFHLIGEGGQLTEVNLPKTHVMEGQLNGGTGEMFMMVNERNLRAEIIEGSDTYRLEPLSDHINDAEPNRYIKYKIVDIIDNQEKTCSFDEINYEVQETEDSSQSLEQRAGNCMKVEITFMGDYELYAYKFGSNFNNTFNWMYWRVVNAGRMYYSYNGFPLNFIIKGAYVNTWNGYIAHAYDHTNFLLQWQNYANNNASWFQRGDANILFTGKNIGGNVVGAAWQWSICNSFYGYGGAPFCFVEHTWNSLHADVITAHEVGHILGAGHSYGGFMNSSVSNDTYMHSTTWNDLNWLWGHNWCLDQWGCQW